jgi:hypothetical protein
MPRPPRFAGFVWAGDVALARRTRFAGRRITWTDHVRRGLPTGASAHVHTRLSHTAPTQRRLERCCLPERVVSLLAVARVSQMGVVLFGSEAAATKVGMGQSINADLIDGNDLATLQHDEQVSTNSSPMSKFGLSSPAAERRFSARQASRDSSGMAASPITSPTMLRASLGDKGRDSAPAALRPPPKAGESGVDVASEVRAGGIAVAAASGQTRGMSRAKRRAEQFGVRVPMTGDTLEASLQMHCEVSGAGYAIYWTRSGDQVCQRAFNATGALHAQRCLLVQAQHGDHTHTHMHAAYVCKGTCGLSPCTA